MCYLLGDLPQEEEELINSKKKEAVEKRPTGRVVGIIRRKWRQYCGILQVNPVKGVSISLQEFISRELNTYKCGLWQMHLLYTKK